MTPRDGHPEHREDAALQAGPRSRTAGMRIEFAPLNIPLRRRLQTAAVLQWVFSFLALGTSHGRLSHLSLTCLRAAPADQGH